MLIFSHLSHYFSKGFIPLEIKNLRFLPTRKRVGSLTGFTLIELIVVSAIILIITAFIMFQQAKFNSATLMRSLTYSVALSIRQAQVYGTSVKEFSGAFAPGYGVQFPASGASADTYYLFADIVPATVGNGAYDNTTEALPSFTLGKGYVIGSLCAVVSGAGTCTPVNYLTVFFRRPNPDACISTNLAPGACAPGAAVAYSSAYITLKSTGNNDTRRVKVSNTGQIAVCAPNTTALTC